MKERKLFQKTGKKEPDPGSEFEDQFTNIASLLGGKARSVMLWTLLDGRAYTATELSVCANITAQSASNHLAKLVNANLLAVEKQGRHRYFRYATPEAAGVVESIATLLPLSRDYKRMKKTEPTGTRFARTCYDHLAGKFGVDITNSLRNKGMIEITGREYRVTPSGKEWLQSIGIDVENIRRQKRSFAHQCLDWSERKHHITGALGAAILQAFLNHDWIRRKQNSREIIITPKGKEAIRNELGLKLTER